MKMKKIMNIGGNKVYLYKKFTLMKKGCRTTQKKERGRSQLYGVSFAYYRTRKYI